MHIRRVIPLLIGAMVALDGCIILPIPTGERGVLQGTPVNQEQLAFLTPNVTTKQEVLGQLGSPSVIWEEARLFAYNWVVSQGILIVGGFGGGDIAPIPKQYALLVQFDEHDRVLRFERVVWPMSKSYGDFLREWVSRSDNTSPDVPTDRE